jgi:hypothetical protein
VMAVNHFTNPVPTTLAAALEKLLLPGVNCARPFPRTSP